MKDRVFEIRPMVDERGVRYYVMQRGWFGNHSYLRNDHLGNALEMRKGEDYDIDNILWNTKLFLTPQEAYAKITEMYGTCAEITTVWL